MHRALPAALLVCVALTQPATGQPHQVTATAPVSGAAGLPAGTSMLTVSAVNASGLYVGSVETNTGPRVPYAWTATGATALGLPPGHIAGVGNAVNAQGWVAGTSYTEFGTGTPTLWRNGTVTAITVPGETDSEVTAISSAGHVTGITGLNRAGGPRGFVWKDGAFTFLPSLAPGGTGQAIPSAVNGAGIAVGYSETAPGVGTATRWANGVAENLGVAGGFSAAKDITEAGDIVVGVADHNGFILRNGEVEYLSRPGAVGVQARAVNAGGDVVGTVYYQDPYNRTEAFLYTDGRWVTGSELLGVPGIVQTQGLDITDDGRVFVIGYDSQMRQTLYELAPGEEGPPPTNGGGGDAPPGVPEPATAVLLGIAGVIGWRRMRRNS